MKGEGTAKGPNNKEDNLIQPTMTEKKPADWVDSPRGSFDGESVSKSTESGVSGSGQVPTPSRSDRDTVLTLRQTAAVMLVLQESTETDKLAEALSKLDDILSQRHGDVIRFLEEKMAGRCVIGVMRRCPDSDIQQVGCRILCHFAEESRPLRREMIGLNLQSYLIQVITENITDHRIQLPATKILAKILETGRAVKQLEAGNQLEKLASLLDLAISAFRDQPEIEREACVVVFHLLKHSDQLHNHFMETSSNILLEVWRSTSDWETVKTIVRTFNSVAENGQCLPNLLEKEVHVVAMDLCAQHPDNTDMMTCVLELLYSLAQDESVQQALVESDFVMEGLCIVLDLNKDSPSTQLVGLRLINILIPKQLTKNTSDELCQKMIHVTYNVMFSYMEEQKIQVAACWVISNLLKYGPKVHQWIGENADEEQKPLHILCIGAILMFQETVETFVAASEALFWIAADNDCLSQCLMDKNVHVAILVGLKKHDTSSEAAEAGCRVLRGFCIFNDSHKKRVIQDGAYPLLTSIQRKFAQDAAVQTEVISAITCLADINMIRYQCVVEKVHEDFITTMRLFPDDEMIQEAGIEAFSVLAGAANGVQMMTKASAHTVTVSAMKDFPKNMRIQKKGLIALQMFAGQDILDAPEFCRDVAMVITSAMRSFPKAKRIQTEACVAMQLLSEDSREISGHFVLEGCHEVLFRRLQNTDDEGVQRLTSECLYVLCVEQNMKSDMLMWACERGVLEGFECLIGLGADVNMGEQEKTPLYQAVCSQNEEMVRLILTQDVHDLMYPLKKSLTLENETITGLILRQVGADTLSGSFTWSDLELNRLEPEWLRVSLASRSIVEFDSDCDLVKKIKACEDRRNQRQQLINSTKSNKMFETSHHRMRHFKKKIIPKYMTSEEEIVSVSLMDETPQFELSPVEAEDWKEDTLTGANIPYSPRDPRQQQTAETKKSSAGEIYESVWTRKRCRSPRGTQILDRPEWMLVGFPTPIESIKSVRKMSAPDLPSMKVTLTAMQRKLSFGSLQAEPDINLGTSSASTEPNQHLLSLDVSNNCICTLQSLADSDEGLLGRFSSIEKLDLSANNLSSLPDTLFENCPALKILDVRANGLETFPVAVLKCQYLQELLLSRNKIKTLGNLHSNDSLCRLDLSHNELTALPVGLGNVFPKLQELLLDNNNLIELPVSPLALRKLKKLNLAQNDLDQIPEEFLLECTSLNCLDVSSNRLDSLPSAEVAGTLHRLSKVKLRRNQLTEKEPFFLPKFVLALPCLRTIDLSENNLTGMPALSLWKSTMLKEVMVAKNKITKLPLEGGKLWSKVEKLDLSSNKLSELPKEIGQLTCLSSLDISYNNITTLPDELGKCSRMWEMPMDGLELDLNRQLLKRRVRDIISYLHNRLKKAKRYYRMKLMVVGYGGRGKTTLLNTLMKKGTTKKRENRPTVGVIVEDWKYEHYEKKNSDDFGKSWGWSSPKKVIYTLNTWDFAGQEEFYSTHQCYLSNRAVYLVLFDLRKGVSDIELLKPWLASIHSRAPGCPVVVVGTHLDKLPNDNQRRSDEVNKISDRLKEFNTTPGFPTIQGAALVDSTSDDKHMTELRSTIKSVVDNYQIKGKHVMGEKVPASYVELADLLSEEAKSLQSSYPVIRYRRLQQIVGDANLDLDEEELDQAVRFLHDSGVILHYDDSSQQLRDFYFIDPGWLCRMMAQIITVRQINPFINRDGIMHRKHVHLLFRDKSFPDSLLQQYINLLQKFEIALPHSENEVLIPCRLPETKPFIQLPVTSKHEKICRIYRMPYVPIGLWFRVISRVVLLTSDTTLKTLLKLSETPKKVCWRRGMFVVWSDNAFLLLDSYSEVNGLELGVHITVPASFHGSRLLGFVVDHIDALIDEWYPGLTSIDPMLGQEIVERLVPCPLCPEEECHRFALKHLQLQADHSDYIMCPNHHSNVHLSLLAPDLVMSDLDISCQMDDCNFEFEQSTENCLGFGGFGNVFRGRYRSKDVAVKMFQAIADIHPLKMLRQEVTILRCLSHPSVVSMVGFGIRPPIIVLELAHCGTLGSMLKNGKQLKAPLQNRIALQVAEGLAYLHDMMIVYRDMKPDNVLVFSDSLSADVNVKISDYGISRFATFEGLKAQEGTLAYRAPEVIRKENYSFQADIFSYGLTMYVMLTCGRHPFDHLESKGEMDRAVAERLPIPPLVVKGAPHWPDMHSLVCKCLQPDPASRPKAGDVWQWLRRADSLCLQRAIPVSTATTVECFTVQESSMRELWLWVASGDLNSFQISRISLTNQQKETKGTMFKYGRILCLEAIGSQYLILGTQLGRVWVFDTVTHTVLHSSAQLPDSVLCLRYIKGEKEGGLLLAGLGNGKVAVFPVTELLKERSVDPFCLGPGHDHEPVCCLERMGKRVFLSCGTLILILVCSKDGITFEKFIETSSDRSCSSSPINSLAVTKGLIIYSTKFSAKFEIWDAVCEKVTKKVDIAQHISSMPYDRVTALAMQDNRLLWVGTHDGHIGVFDITTMSLLVKTQRYVRSVRTIYCIKDHGFSAYKGVLSGGLGFRETPIGATERASENMYGCVLLWDWNFAHHALSSIEYEKKRSLLEEQLKKPT